MIFFITQVNGFNMLIDGGFSRHACFWGKFATFFTTQSNEIHICTMHMYGLGVMFIPSGVC